MSDAATHTHPLTNENGGPADPPPYPKPADSLAIITNATSQELICSGNPAFAHLIQSNMRSAEDYTALVRAYLRLAEYCHYVVKMHSDIRQKKCDDYGTIIDYDNQIIVTAYYKRNHVFPIRKFPVKPLTRIALLDSHSAMILLEGVEPHHEALKISQWTTNGRVYQIRESGISITEVGGIQMRWMLGHNNCVSLAEWKALPSGWVEVGIVERSVKYFLGNNASIFNFFQPAKLTSMSAQTSRVRVEKHGQYLVARQETRGGGRAAAENHHQHESHVPLPRRKEELKLAVDKLGRNEQGNNRIGGRGSMFGGILQRFMMRRNPECPSEKPMFLTASAGVRETDWDERPSGQKSKRGGGGSSPSRHILYLAHPGSSDTQIPWPITMSAPAPTYSEAAAARSRIAQLDIEIEDLQRSLDARVAELRRCRRVLARYKHPILTLPVELISEIFIQFLPSYRRFLKPRVDSESPSPAPSMPPMARYRVKDAGIVELNWRTRKQKLQQLEIWLERSGNHPLSIRLCDVKIFDRETAPIPTIQFAEAIMRHASHLQHFEIEVPYEDLHGFTGPMPMLRSVLVGPSDTMLPDTTPSQTAVPVFMLAPNLKKVVLSTIFNPFTITLPWSQLTILTADLSRNVHAHPLPQDDPVPAHPTVSVLPLRSLSLIWGEGDRNDSLVALINSLTLPVLDSLVVSELLLGADPIAALYRLRPQGYPRVLEIKETRLSFHVYKDAFPDAALSVEPLEED
ncbi:hypothetical protein FB45DRAFT_1085340 [Roridomyces roridus]|uniref:F-box domain-containing protein n=1 Tax=Roridomyces roridus TaxID=1738132 RepID=A0AAD7AXZ9_9AGAR|nr:hypothetical protein FB45DRAFT_1085340 [Roridomyces roridus]